MTKQGKLVELDILRAIAIVAIMLLHGNEYAPVAFLTSLRHRLDLAYLGLGIFVFISGYLVDCRTERPKNAGDMLVFMKKRMLRIYPLYIPAVLVFVLFYERQGFPSNIPDILVNMGSGQILLASYFMQIKTLWYIGLIVLFYLLYIILRRFTDSTFWMMSWAAMLFGVFIISYLGLGLFQDRFFIYYPIFFAGIVSSRMGIFAFERAKLWKVSLFMVIGAGVFLVAKTFGTFAERPVVDCILIIVRMFGLVFVALGLARLWSRVISGRSFKLVYGISTASFVVYLYHRPMFTCVKFVLTRFVEIDVVFRSMLNFLFFLPLLFVFAYYIQVFTTRAIHKFTLLSQSKRVAG